MRKFRYFNILFVLVILTPLLFFRSTRLSAQEENQELLPSWNDGPAKSVILEYVKNATSSDSDGFIEEEDRVAIFRDNGTLISEKPEIQIVFLEKSIKRLAKKDPELIKQEPFRSVERDGMEYLEGLDRGMLANIDKVLREKAGEEFYREMVRDFLTTAKDPHFDLLYADLVYEPMKGLLSYLKAFGFKTFIISSGDVAFTRSISESLYGLSPDRVMDLDAYKSSEKKKPVIAAGRMKDGEDIEMLMYCQSNELPSLQILIEHDDGEREFQYGQNDRRSLDAAKKYGWIRTSMKDDWKTVFPAILKKEPEKKEAPEQETAPVMPVEEAEEDENAGIPTEAPGAGPHIGITRPLPEKGPTKVDVALFIIDIDEINTVNQSFAANIYTAFKWWDPRLAHGGKGTVNYNLNDIWSPRILLMNRQRLWKSFPLVAEVNSSGETVYQQRSWGYFSQPLDLRDFPFDEQTLNFTFVTPGYTAQEIQLLFAEPMGFGMAENFSVPDWTVVGWEYTTKPFSPREGRDLGTITYSLKLKRHSEHYIYKVVIPLVFIVIMSWVVFWIDPKEVGTNVAAATTCFLTLVAYRFAISASLPEIPYFTRLDALVFWSTILVFSSLVQAIVLSYFVHRNRETLARRIDLVARFVYPVLFIVTIIFTLAK